jgi:hypothetical protein
VSFLKFRLAELGFDGRELTLKDPDEKIPASAGWFKESRVNPLGLAATRFLDFISVMSRALPH